MIYPYFAEKEEKYVLSHKDRRLNIKYFREYLQYILDNHLEKNYKRNLHFMSVVDEAHALINPTKEDFRSSNFCGWCCSMGPEAFHVINESQISVFFTDGKQSFRDNETTTIEDIKAWAEELGAHFSSVSLDGMQFRCAGSYEYVDWVENLFSEHPLHNVTKWADKFKVKVVDFPSEMEDDIRQYVNQGNASCRLMSSYTRKWISTANDEMHSKLSEHDFVLDDKEGSKWKKYWNSGKHYDIYVQGSRGTMMNTDPLSEIGCPYVVRGFDYDYVGLLWLEDIIVRNWEWCLNLDYIEEKGFKSDKVKAKEALKLAKKHGKYRGKVSGIIPSKLDGFPAVNMFFNAVTQAYRILLTRAIKGVTIYIKDEETRAYVRKLLKGE